MDDGKMREAFEAHLNGLYGSDQSSDWPRTHASHWATWQAALASLSTVTEGELAEFLEQFVGQTMAFDLARAILTRWPHIKGGE